MEEVDTLQQQSMGGPETMEEEEVPMVQLPHFRCRNRRYGMTNKDSPLGSLAYGFFEGNASGSPCFTNIHSKENGFVWSSQIRMPYINVNGDTACLSAAYTDRQILPEQAVFMAYSVSEEGTTASWAV